MAKSRPFSIYLLKVGFDAENTLKEDLPVANAGNLPEGATLFVLDDEPTTPWWRQYFQVEQPLTQVFKGALLFLPVGERNFVLAFGHVAHHLKDHAYVYDFGLRVSLNSIDPAKLKSADMVAPGPSLRKRTQVPISTELTFLDFDGNSEIIRSLTGAVKAEHAELFKNATGSIALKINLKLPSAQLPELCASLLGLYDSEDYKTAFPNIQNIAPVRDPSKIAELDAFLVAAVRVQSADVELTIPDIVDYRGNTCCMFLGAGRSDIYPDIALGAFYEYVQPAHDPAELDLEDLKQMRVMLTDSDGTAGPTYSIYRSVIFDVEPNGEDVIYHLCEGEWYRAEKAFVDRLRNYLDARCEANPLCPYDHDEEKDGKRAYSEGAYNEAVPGWNGRYICLDRTDIRPMGSTEIEPCDLYEVGVLPGDAEPTATLYHIKISTRSSSLSHLFNQGVNSIDLVQLEEVSRNKLRQLVTERIGANNLADYLVPIDALRFKVVFGVITHRDANLNSGNLPLFSRISLMRAMQDLDVRRVRSALVFIDDQSPAKGSHAEYPQILIEVCTDEAGKKCVRAVPGQDGYDPALPIDRCPLAVRSAALGTRFRGRVNIREDGSLGGHHSYPYALID